MRCTHYKSFVVTVMHFDLFVLIIVICLKITHVLCHSYREVQAHDNGDDDDNTVGTRGGASTKLF